MVETAGIFTQIPNGISVVQFSAPWCGPCRMITPIIESLSDEMAGVTFFKVDVETEGEMASEYNVRQIPVIVFLKDGVEINRTLGMKTKNELKQIINSLL